MTATKRYTLCVERMASISDNTLLYRYLSKIAVFEAGPGSVALVEWEGAQD